VDNVKWDAPDLAERYDAISDSQYERGLILMDMMSILNGGMVLDVGCGTGRMALHVADLVGPSGKVFGIDPSPHRIRVAIDKLKDGAFQNVRFIQGRGEDLGAFQDGVFDDVYLCSVFHWIDDKRSALREIYRVLKPGGMMGMTTGNKNNPTATRAITNRILAREEYAGKVKPENDAARHITKDELEMLLSDAGFGDIRVGVRMAKRHFESPEEVLKFNEASTFGTFLKHVPEDLRPGVRREIEQELEKRRTPSGIEFETHTIYATAIKPYK
jgi:ubiquinone/menaquinone biosynthesis C-methylase UbiE